MDSEYYREGEYLNETASDNTLTREQVEKAISDIASAQYDGKEPEGWQVTVVCEAADAWLEGPQITDEMIERGAMVLEQKLWASASFSHDMSEAVLRAALEMEHE